MSLGMALAYRRVLIADDIAPVRRTLARLATAALGAEVIETANDGAEVLERLAWAREREAPFDLLISDIGMPRFSGVGLLVRMRSLGLDAPTLFCTGRSDCPAIGQLHALGFIVLDKPFGPPAVVSALQSRPRSPMQVPSLDTTTALACTSTRATTSACADYCGASVQLDDEAQHRLMKIREGRRRLSRRREPPPPA
jgi:CheY-like chemotaxis protein